MKVRELCNEWLEQNHKYEIKRQSYVKYQGIIKNYIEPYIGDIDVTDINRKNLSEFLYMIRNTKGRKTGKPLSSSIIGSIIAVLKMVFEYAIDMEIIDEFPKARIKGSRKIYRNEIKCFTLEEQRKIEKYCIDKGSREWFGIVLALYTGLRVGELLALEWNDINFNTGMLSVNKTQYHSKNDSGEWVDIVGEPKTRSSVREIPLPEFILKTLKQLYQSKTGTRIVCDKNGNYIQDRIYRRHYYKMLEELGIRRLTFHSLRHTFATRALELGIDVKTISEILGHSNSAITLNIYAHALDDHKKEAMQKFEGLYDYK